MPLIERYKKWKQQQAAEESSESEEQTGNQSNAPTFEFDISDEEPKTTATSSATSTPKQEKRPAAESKEAQEKKEYVFFTVHS